jgi:hypothetical protein
MSPQNTVNKRQNFLKSSTQMDNSPVQDHTLGGVSINRRDSSLIYNYGQEQEDEGGAAICTSEKVKSTGTKLREVDQTAPRKSGTPDLKLLQEVGYNQNSNLSKFNPIDRFD